jgi:serine phosphatase RsbU (regulator of sigma subunit)
MANQTPDHPAHDLSGIAVAVRALDSITDGVAVIATDWTIRYVNPSGCAVLGRDAGALVGRDLWAEFPAAIGGEFHRSMLAAAGPENADGAEVSWQAPDAPVDGWLDATASRTGDEIVVVFRRSDDRRAEEAERARLTAEIRQSLQRSQLLLLASQALAKASSVDEIIATVAHLASGGLAPATIGLILLDDDGRTMRRSLPDDLPEAVRPRWTDFDVDADLPPAVSARKRRPLYLEDRAEIVEAFPHLIGDLVTLRREALAYAPLLGSQGVLGVLSFGWEEPHPMDTGERAVITALAGYTAQALQRITFVQQKANAAEILQRAMLTTLTAPDGLELEARYRPAVAGEQVGGDWYDAFPLTNGATALVIGDVVGHDLAAAALMGQLRSMLRAFAFDSDEPPSAVLGRLDRANRHLGTETMATAVLARVEPPLLRGSGGYAGPWTLRWSNAGHPAPILRHPDGRTTLLTGRDLLLGAHPDIRRYDHTAAMPAGSLLLLYTDGLVERREESYDAMTDRLCVAVTDLGTGPLGQILDAVLDHMVDHQPADDVAVLALRIR